VAISAVLQFASDTDARTIYDAVIEEMGVRDNAPEGAIYHWAAPVPGGIRVCDLWETAEAFEEFAQAKIGPLTAKHGLKPPAVEVDVVHNIIKGDVTSHSGMGLIIEVEGDSKKLLAAYDATNAALGANKKAPAGLVMHSCAATAKGIRIVDHWCSREEFEQFAKVLGPALAAAGMPDGRFEQFDVYNTIDARVKVAS